MPLIVRVINNKIYWDDDLDNKGWLSPGEIRSDLLNDFATKDDCFSIYVIDEDKDHDIYRVLTAIASTKDYFDKIDYTVFDQDLLGGLNVKISDNLGKTPDKYVNELHVDVDELTADLRLLITKDVKSLGLRCRLTKSIVQRLIRENYEKGNIDISLMKPSLRSKLEYVVVK